MAAAARVPTPVELQVKRTNAPRREPGRNSLGIRHALDVREPSPLRAASSCGAIRPAARISSSRGGEPLAPHVTTCSARPRKRSRELFDKSARLQGAPVTQGPAILHRYLAGGNVPGARLVRPTRALVRRCNREWLPRPRV